MTVELNKQQNIILTGSAPVGPTEGTNATRVSVPIGQVNDVVANEDTTKFGTTTTSEQTTLRQAGEVDKTLGDITNKTGLSKNELLELIKKITGKSYEDLLNLKQADYNNLTKGLELIIISCKVNGEIDSAKLEQATKDYNIASQTGWSLKGFYDHQKNVKKSSIVDRLIDANCLGKAIDPNDPDYDAKMEAAIEKFFEKTLLSRIDKNTPLAEREKIYKAQLQTFGRLLVNTPEGRDKELLGAAIDKLYRSNIVSAANAGIDAMETVESKANFAKHIDYKESVTTASAYEEGVYMTTEQAQQLAHIKYNNMNANDIESDMLVMKNEATEFFEKNKEILAIIDKKIEKHEELTEEEKAIKRERENLHKARYAGATTGIANSQNPTVAEERETLLSTMTADIHEIGEKAGNSFYQEVLTEVAKFVKEHPEVMTLSETEFEQLMDKVTENISDIKYSDIAKTVVPQTTTKQSQSTPAVEVKGSFGVPQKEAPANLMAPVNQISQLYSTPTQETETKSVENTSEIASKNFQSGDFVTSVRNGGVKAFYDKVGENGMVRSLADAFNNKGLIDNNIIDIAKNLYKTFTDKQDDILERLSMKGIRQVSELTDQSTWKKVQNKTFGSFGATKLIKENSKKALEENV